MKMKTAFLFAIATVLMPLEIAAQGPSLVLVDGGLEFPDGSLQMKAAGSYENVLVVAKSGGDFSTIQAAVNAAGPAGRWLVWVAPGVYTERVTMRGRVDIQGAGPLATIITFGGSPMDDTGTVVGATDAELRFLTVENTGGPGLNAIAVFNDEASPRLTHIQAIALSGSNAYGVYNKNSSPAMTDVFVSGSLAGIENYGVYNWTTDPGKASRPLMERVVIFNAALSATAKYFGVRNLGGSAPVMDNVDITCFWGSEAYGVSSLGSAPQLNNVRIEVNTAAVKNVGLYSHSSSSPTVRNSVINGFKGLSPGSTAYGVESVSSTPLIHHSAISGGTNPVSGSSPKIAHSQLVGTKVTLAAGSCVGAYDENFQPLSHQCD